MSGLTVIFDGRCSFCIRALRPIQWLDRGRNLRFVDANDEVAVRSAAPAVAGADLSDAMFVVDRRNRTFRGFFAFRRLVFNSAWTWPLILLFYAPGASFFGPRVYAWVARNRYRFGCVSAQCSLPEALKLTDAPEVPR